MQLQWPIQKCFTNNNNAEDLRLLEIASSKLQTNTLTCERVRKKVLKCNGKSSSVYLAQVDKQPTWPDNARKQEVTVSLIVILVCLLQVAMQKLVGVCSNWCRLLLLLLLFCSANNWTHSSAMGSNWIMSGLASGRFRPPKWRNAYNSGEARKFAVLRAIAYAISPLDRKLQSKLAALLVTLLINNDDLIWDFKR